MQEQEKSKKNISEAEAIAVAHQNMIDGLEVIQVERITSTGDHHEYRSGPLPAYVISYKKRLKIYGHTFLQRMERLEL